MMTIPTRTTSKHIDTIQKKVHPIMVEMALLASESNDLTQYNVILFP